jgi:hypothetical protein
MILETARRCNDDDDEDGSSSKSASFHLSLWSRLGDAEEDG